MSDRVLSRRELLRIGHAAGIGLVGLAFGGCAPTLPAAPTATAGVAQTGGAATAAWDQLVAAAQKEARVVVSGPIWTPPRGWSET